MLDFMISGTLLLEESNIGEQVMKTSLNIDMHPGNATKLGDQNQNGILWYVPKAPSGRVTKKSIIPKYQFVLNGKQRWRC
ncbi:unnamed protein product [Prunus armeniaca]|uniref:Uncharacterized protein n=1 Tax=Prunus armeniaca TaxID=36596 RepID=A0A6J5U1Q5_PRUAR|nr:unnamed protein product [Prunus armeniaca]CAB4300673.1 unnamed protein product [Prunus armeniaca]